jgi:monofunctional biosynthetic peptidoglycan transglycosylase
VLAYAAAAYAALVAALTVLYRFVDPPMSALMLQHRLTGQDVLQDWVPLEAVSSNVVKAVIVSEDGRFCQHNGVDFEEMQAAIERAGDGTPRGASTISMQVVKNLYLWPSKSYVRKAIEIPLTYLMEMLWPKRRIMEVYLNIAEWGPGIFGVEAASQFHFNKPASRLSEREAARLAVALPNPLMRDAGDPGPQTLRLASEIQSRMRQASLSQTACVLREN